MPRTTPVSARAFACAIITASLAAFSASAARAEIIVLGSNAPGLAVGKVLGDEATLSVPAGSRVRIMLPSGSTREVKGPASHKVAELTAGQSADRSLWNDVKRIVTTAKRSDESAIGAVRSAAPSSAERGVRAAPPPRALRPAFSWRHVPIDGEDGGDVCIERGARLQLVRAAPGRPQRVAVVNRQSQVRGETDFAVGSTTAAWPAAVGADVGLYVVVLPDGAKRSLRLRPIDPLPAADETLRLLHSQRCLVQVEAWLRGLAVAGR